VAAVSDPVLPDTWVPVASAIGLAWAEDCARVLATQERNVVGAWPGTMREARSRVIAGVSPMANPQRADAMAYLDDLARATYLAARRHWDTISEPDLEP
jgi:hypothetical protein